MNILFLATPLVLIISEHQMLQLPNYFFIYVLLFAVIVCTTISYTFQNNSSTSYLYKITQKTNEGLKVYIKFTGNQFLIVNHDSFDWMDVTFAITTESIGNHTVSETMAGRELILAVPRIKSGTAYTVDASQLTADVATWARTPTALAYHLRILGTTPWGKSFWHGRWE
jgi:hypothetical protein